MSAADAPEPDVDLDRLRQVLGKPELRRLVGRLASRIAFGRPVETGTVTLTDAGERERFAVASLLGRHVGQGASVSVPLDTLAVSLRNAGLAPTVELAVEALVDHPIPRRAALAAEQEQAREEAYLAAWGGRHTGEGWYLEWAWELKQDGTLTRLLRRHQGELIGAAARVLDRLPSDPLCTLPVLAELATGDTKALSGTPLATLVLRALAKRETVEPPSTAAERRRLWESAGVVSDDLSSQVLLLNLPTDPSVSALARWVSDAAAVGVPFRVTLHQLREMPLPFRGKLLYVCENPAVLRAAVAELGPSSAPLVCTEGVPSLACDAVLRAAADSGAAIRWRGDFDWTGVRTTTRAIERYGATPWRMGLADYDGALKRGESEPLRGPRVPTPWDEDLSGLMSDHSRAVMEERLLPHLLTDLAQHRTRPGSFQVVNSGADEWTRE